MNYKKRCLSEGGDKKKTNQNGKIDDNFFNTIQNKNKLNKKIIIDDINNISLSAEDELKYECGLNVKDNENDIKAKSNINFNKQINNGLDEINKGINKYLDDDLAQVEQKEKHLLNLINIINNNNI